ncbi:MAG: DNA polymerase III subunit delta [Bacteroidales bacterium]|nr:DNA polymerase III subunit delta [Bacteroidales bacterium]MCM1148304.1 DNA polymerase III subunit delta [Bacteroidales bacterium]MCM1206508.1 DNA polymerase III subunit delta [Bacillota bacterium]
MQWNEVIGQQDVKDRLMGLVNGGRMPHALMLCGETGYGTLALATALATELLHKTTEYHPDLHFSFPTVKLPSMGGEHKPVSNDFIREWHDLLKKENSYITLDQWMESMKATTQQAIITAAESDELAKKLSLKSSQGGYKVAVIWLAERMNDESANKILKTLEEPSEQTVFILCVERPERLLETIRSRVQRIDVPKIDSESLENALIGKCGLDATVAHKLSRAADGNWLTAVGLLSPDSEQALFLDLFKMLMRQVYARDIRGMKKWSETVAAFGREKQKRLLTYFMRMVREAFISNFRNPELSYMTAEEEQFVSKFGRFVNEANVIDINSLLELALRDISQNTNQKIVFFDTALRLTVLIFRK